MATPTRRTLEFTGRTTRSFREQAIAVAWITVKHGGGFENDNVGRHIQRLLAAEGFAMTAQQVATTMARLDSLGYAARSVHTGKHRLFVMDPDVDVPEPEFIKALRLRDAQRAASNGHAPVRPPVPAPVHHQVTPPWMADLLAAVSNWWDEDQSAADRWAADVLASLGER